MADATDFDLLKISDIEEPEGPAWLVSELWPAQYVLDAMVRRRVPSLRASPGIH